MTSLLVGLDVGTSSIKAVVFDVDGRQVSDGKSATPWTAVPVGTEMRPDLLMKAVFEALQRALTAAPAGPVLGLGVASMGESGVLLDGHGVPMAPIIAWHDSRDITEIAELDAWIGADGFARKTGLPMRGQWSLTKHRWLVKHHPELTHAVRRLNVAEWVVRSLGGVEACEQSLASRTGWLGLSERDWWADGLEWSGARASLMPELVTAGTPLGVVAGVSGLDRLSGVVMTVAGHDHQAAAVGAGAIGPGDELDSCGSAEALIRTIVPGLHPDAVARLAAAGITCGWHAVPDRWCLLGGTQGGLELQRVLDELNISADQLAEFEASAPSDAARRWLATVEAVTEDARAVHLAMSEVAGECGSLVATGGWARSKYLLQAKTRLLGELTVSPVAEAGARGAALLAGVAAEVYGSLDELPTLARDDREVVPA